MAVLVPWLKYEVLCASLSTCGGELGKAGSRSAPRPSLGAHALLSG